MESLPPLNVTASGHLTDTITNRFPTPLKPTRPLPLLLSALAV